MTLAAGLAVTGLIERPLDAVPVIGMGIEANRATLGAVTLETDIAIGMARLAGGKGAPRLAGMADLPVVEAWRH